MLANLSALWRYRDLVRNLAARDLRVKYKDSTLGFAWSLLHPLIMVAVYTLAFRYVLAVRIDRFPIFLLSGLLPWMFFSGALVQATSSIADHGTLVRKVAFPRMALPLGAIGSQFVQFLLMFGTVIPVGLAVSGGGSAALLALIPLCALQLVFTTGVALMTATAFVFFRDTRHLLEVALQVWFWLTPVVYSAALVPEPFDRLLALNPMAAFITAYHGVVLDATWPAPAVMTALGGLSVAAGVAGLLVFFRHQGRFAELV
jgi:ABC-type polysaccharide/polyol phosphate export permease